MFLERESINLVSSSSKNYIFDGSGNSLQVSQEFRLPLYSVTCSLNVHIKKINELFQRIAIKLGFGIIEKEENFSMAVYRKCCSIKKMLSLCFNVQDDSIMTAIKLEITLNEIKCLREIKVKGVYGV